MIKTDKTVMKMKNIVIAGLMITTLLAPAVQAANLFDWHLGARAMSLGGAYTASGSDVDAVAWNPAGLALMNKAGVMTGYTSSFGDVSHYYLAGAAPALYGTLGAYVVNANLSTIPNTSVDADGRPVINGYYADTQWLIGLGYSQEVLTKGLTAGGTLKGYQHRMADYSTNGFGLDLGLLYDLNQSELMGQTKLPVTFGLTAMNVLQPKLSWASGWSDTVSRRIFVGAAYKGTLMDNPLTVTADINPAGGSPKLWGVGAEYFLTPMFPVRLGYGNYYGSSQLGLGVGLVYNEWGVDVAYQNHPDLGSNIQLSLAWRPDFKMFSLKQVDSTETIMKAQAEEVTPVQTAEADQTTVADQQLAEQPETVMEIPITQPVVQDEGAVTQTETTIATTPLTINDILQKSTVDRSSSGKVKVYARIRNGFGNVTTISFVSNKGEKITLTRSSQDDLYWTGVGKLKQSFSSFKIYVKLADGSVVYWLEDDSRLGLAQSDG